jgi:TonB-linked SusC/RagA family outer membrane protein
MKPLRPLRLWGLLCLAPLFSSLPHDLNAQQPQAGRNVIRGVVTDAADKPLQGVHIIVVGSSSGATTDAKGNFALQTPSDLGRTARIRFTYVGMKPVEVEYNGRTHIDVTMQEDSKAIEDVVVTGMLNIQRRDMVGSFVQLAADSVLLPSQNSIDEMLQGQIAGMAVKMPMRAGAAPEITIRGRSTLLGSSAPLWVVDGVIQPQLQQSSGWWTGWQDSNENELNNIIGSQISWLNPNDIETITVLKDASATAIYGSRASNGVIAITTKKGVSDRLSVRASYNMTVGQQLNYGLYNLMNSQERINFAKEAFNEGVFYQNVPIPQTYTYEGMYALYLSGKLSEQEFIRRYNYLETVNTNWFDLITRPSLNQNFSVSASGGTSKATFTSSISYARNLATEIGNDNERYTGRIAVGVELAPKLRADASLSGSLSRTTGFAGAGIDPIGYSTRTSRAIPAYEQDGQLAFYRVRESYTYNENTRTEGLPYNIIDDMANTGSRVENPVVNATIDLKWRLLRDLTWQAVGGFILNSRLNESWMGENSIVVVRDYRGYRTGSPESVDPLYRNAAVLKNGGILITDQNYTRNFDFRTQLNYTHTFASEHRVTAMAMWEVNSSYNNSKYNTVFGYDKFRGERIAAPTPPSEMRPIGVGAPSDYVNTYLKLPTGFWKSNNFTDNKASMAMIVAYSLKNKYVLNGNFRNDWSNTFGQSANRRFNPAFSLGLSWKLAEEPFMERLQNYISQANFRVTYGTQGNVANTQTAEMILRYQPIHPIIEEPYSSITRIANPFMTWERTNTWNAGLDLGLFKNRITLVVDGYTRMSNVGRTFTDTPENGGFSSTLTGTYMRNTGLELTVGFTPIASRGWRMSLSANIARNWNLIVKENISEAVTYSTPNFLSGISSQVFEGYPMGAFWAYSYAGPDPDYGIPTFNRIHSGSYTSQELTSDPRDFLVYAGSRIPDVSGGLTLRVAYRNLSLNSSLAVTLGGKGFLNNPYSSFSNGHMPEPTSNLNKELLGRWTPTNKGSWFPGLYIVPNETADPILLTDPSGHVGVDRYSMWARSDARLVSLSSLRCRNINLSYTLTSRNRNTPTAEFMRKIGIISMELTAGMNNVFLIADSKWEGMDPDLGGDRKAPRSFTLGLSVGF